MERQPLAPKFNKVWAKSVSKDKFVSAFKGVKQYEGLDFGKEYDKIVPPKEKKSEDK